MAEKPAERKVDANLPQRTFLTILIRMTMEVMAVSWSVADAKARLSSLIEHARTGPQVITRNGRPTAVVVSIEEWERRTTRSGTLADFLAASPLHKSDLRVERSKDPPRKTEL
jgi:prevent-host-death family protein